MICTQQRSSRVSGTPRGSPPRTEGTVAHRHDRRAHPALLEVAQQRQPALGRLAAAVLERHHFLRAVRAGPDHDQGGELLVLQAHVEVHPIRPDVHVVVGSASGRARKARYSSSQELVNRMIALGESPAAFSTRSAANREVDPLATLTFPPSTLSEYVRGATPRYDGKVWIGCNIRLNSYPRSPPDDTSSVASPSGGAPRGGGDEASRSTARRCWILSPHACRLVVTRILVAGLAACYSDDAMAAASPGYSGRANPSRDRGVDERTMAGDYGVWSGGRRGRP